jgi:hypothetical protein
MRLYRNLLISSCLTLVFAATLKSDLAYKGITALCKGDAGYDDASRPCKPLVAR